MAVKSTRLLAAAVDVGLISAERLAELTLRARREHMDLVDLVCIDGRFPPGSLYQALAECRQLPFYRAHRVSPDADAMRKLPRSMMQRNVMVPVLALEQPALWLADPDDQSAIDMARRLMGDDRPLVVGTPEEIAVQVENWLLSGSPASADATTDNTDLIELLDQVFKHAYLARASDIHFEPGREGMRVRIRVDGRLQDYPQRLTSTQGNGMASRIKVLAGLDIAEAREPQDGGMRHQIGKIPAFDVRVATVPTRFGERVTLRLLGTDTEPLTLARLGMSERALEGFRHCIGRPHGMILITGPTGSGKSTTLYAALSELVSPQTNVLTVEDPIERVLVGASQVQVNSKLAFAGALRSFLRHDPDVIMVGEIRDLETADVALKAAVTGHLVFSTLHTNSAASAVTRLADMGSERFMIGATLGGVIAQRLVRRLCPRCKRSRAPQARERLLLGEAISRLYEPVGCSACVGTGWRGRIGIFETLWFDEHLGALIAAGANETQLQAAASAFESLWQDGQSKIAQGLTTLDEVLRITLPEPPSSSAPLPHGES